MATLMSIASGNLSSASTWALCSSAAALDNETATTSVTTSNVSSSSFVLAAATYDGVAVKISSTSLSIIGTFTVELYNSTVASIAGTQTVNVSDLGDSTLTTNSNGWAFLKFSGGNYTANGTDSFVIRVRCSSSGNQVVLYRDGTAGNWSRQVRTTTTQAPASGDKLIICGEYTGTAGTQPANTFNVTMDLTTTTSSTNFAGTGGNNAGIGAVAWTNTGNITSSNDSRATVSLNNGTISNYLLATNFGFALPAGATVVGVKFDIEKSVTSGSASDTQVNLVVGGNVFSAMNYALSTVNANWPGSDTVYSYGSFLDNWNYALTDSEVNASGFGVAIACTGRTNGTVAAVDAVQCTVAYTTMSFVGVIVCRDCSLTYDTSASTTYALRVNGFAITASSNRGVDIHGGGTLNIGTNGTPIPSTSYAILDLNVGGTTVGVGVEVRAQGTMNCYGSTKTTVWTRLTANASLAATTLTVASTSGWAAGDFICIAGTTTTINQSEKAQIKTVDSGTQVTLVDPVNFAHDGTNNTQGDSVAAEVGNLNRNVIIRGVGTINSAMSYINTAASSVINWQYVELYKLGSVTTNKRGVDVTVTSLGSFDASYCSLHDFTATNSRGFNLNSSTNSNVTLSYNITYNIANEHYNTTATTGTWTFTNNLAMLNASASALFNLGDIGGTCTNNVAVSTTSSANGFNISETTPWGNSTFTGNVAHACNGNGFNFTSQGTSSIGTVSVISSCVAWRNAARGFSIGPCNNTTFSSCKAFGNTSDNILLSASIPGPLYFISCSCYSEGATAPSPGGLCLSSASTIGHGKVYIYNTTFGDGTNNHTIADVRTSGSVFCELYLSNCLLRSTPEVNTASLALLPPFAFIASQDHDQSAGSHKTFKREGVLTSDTSIYNTASPSLRITPRLSTEKCTSIGSNNGIFVPVNSGEAPNVSIKVRKSVVGDGAAYNGNQPRLMLKKNYSIGVTSDTVIATATNSANGAFETISGTPSAASADGVMEFYVDCDGTAGWVNVDDFTAA